MEKERNNINNINENYNNTINKNDKMEQWMHVNATRIMAFAVLLRKFLQCGK